MPALTVGLEDGVRACLREIKDPCSVATGHPLHLEEPEWETGLDLAGGAAVQTRRALAARAASEKMRVMAFHFPFPSVGRLEPRAGHGWNWNVGQ